MEVHVLKQEVHFLKTELSNELLNLRDQFQGDFSNVLRGVDIGDYNSREVLRIFEETSKKTVKDQIEFYDATKTGHLDFALGSLGGSIVSTRGTTDYKSHSGTSAHSVQHIIQSCVMPGECWAFKGSGAVVIRLIGKVNITAVSIEHVSRDLLPKGAIKNAPKDFSVWGLDSLNDKGHCFGNFSYDINGNPLQYFRIQEASANSFQLIELKIHNNHGNPTYTCLYRFRVHGIIGHPTLTQTVSN
ncbi:hypothetical protein B7P43_G16157 [Cryptotermes secundus]|uniref:SUN domain-containing protein n=1 Tax=Cryptotermes secundus TaxID=105785 RepID=A0A2J7R4H4_9NEOP|nr:hypothetical protein B7P43_G16157 [Cryptotermes secundus]